MIPVNPDGEFTGPFLDLVVAGRQVLHDAAADPLTNTGQLVHPPVVLLHHSCRNAGDKPAGHRGRRTQATLVGTVVTYAQPVQIVGIEIQDGLLS